MTDRVVVWAKGMGPAKRRSDAVPEECLCEACEEKRGKERVSSVIKVGVLEEGGSRKGLTHVREKADLEIQ